MAEHGVVYSHIFSPLVGLIANEVWKPVKKQLSHCFTPASSVDALTTAVVDLSSLADNLDEKIQDGAGQRKTVRPQAAEWIRKARAIEASGNSLKEMHRARRVHLLGCSWNCFSNYTISKAATSAREDAVEHKGRAPHDDAIFRFLPPVAREMPVAPNIIGQEKYLATAIRCLRDHPSPGVVAIYGMGGAGKTTLLKSINNHYCQRGASVGASADDGLEFDHVIFAEVGRKPDLKRLQRSIATQAGLLIKDDEDITSGATAIFNFFREKSFLLLLDDLWEKVALEIVGLPMPCASGAASTCKNHKVVIATRSWEVCCEMKATNSSVKLACLVTADAWRLFEAYTGEEVLSDSRIRELADVIVTKCAGLPLALKTVGQTMASKRTPEEWEHTVKLLQTSRFHRISPGVSNELFSVLYISYDNLGDDVARNCFLFYSLWPVYQHMYAARAIKSWVGHGLFDGCTSDLEEAYGMGHCVLGTLKRVSLLESNPRGDKYVRMHDVMRELALCIIASEHNGDQRWLLQSHNAWAFQRWSNVERITMGSDHAEEGLLHMCTECPRLASLVLCDNPMLARLPPGLFPCLPALTYLDLSWTAIRQLPPQVGSLANLEFLDLSCTPLVSLPVELSLLKKLRYLEMEYTYKLRSIPYGLLSQLHMLRALNLYESPCLLRDAMRVHIGELERLTALRSLGFTVGDIVSARRLCELPHCTVRFMSIKEMRGVACLRLSPSLLGGDRARHLQNLILCDTKDLDSVVVGEEAGNSASREWILSGLDELRFCCVGLNEVAWNGVDPRVCLSSLRIVYIECCPNLRNIKWIEHIPALEELYITSCGSIRELVPNHEPTDDDSSSSPSSSPLATDSFPRLKRVGLVDLENLVSVCSGNAEFPALTRLLVNRCWKLRSLPCKMVQTGKTEMVFGERQWWDSLEWDGSMEQAQSWSVPYFRELPDGYDGTKESILKLICSSYFD